MNKPGIFITLDGVDGAGKTTQLNFIKSWLAENHIDVVFTREPGGTELGEKLRSFLLDVQSEISVETETLLMFAGRKQHIDEVILPNLKQGRWVVSDRFTDATFAYQGAGRGVNIEKITQLEKWVQGDLQADLTVILDVPLLVSQTRIQKNRVKDRFELEAEAFFERVRASYLSRAAAAPHRYAVINTDRLISDVQDDLAAILTSLLQGWAE